MDTVRIFCAVVRTWYLLHALRMCVQRKGRGWTRALLHLLTIRTLLKRQVATYSQLLSFHEFIDMADDLTEDEKAERAKAFRANLNRQRPSRKRYLVSSQVLQREQLEQTLEASASGYSQFTPTASMEVGVPLQELGGEAIYREIQEKESLSKLKNGLREFIPQPIRGALLPPRNCEEWKNFLLVHLPILQWLWSYRPKLLIGDLIAGVTIGVTQIPQGMYVYLHRIIVNVCVCV